jgi:homoserine O-acetyltransferase/O-succinyltransferase
VQAQTLVVGFTSDWLFPPEQNRAIATALLRAGKRASYAELAPTSATTPSCWSRRSSTTSSARQLYDLVRGFLASSPGPA